MRPQEDPPRRRTMVAVGDVAVVVAILATLTMAGVAVVQQRASDDAAAEVARWAQERGVGRVAWPSSLREAVPALRDEGVVPVLVDEDAPAQQYAVVGTEVVVTRGGASAPAAVLDAVRLGDLTAHLVDLSDAGAVPLAVGDTVREEISRPYRYAPLRPSRTVPPGAALERALVLEPGRYEVGVEAFVGVEADGPATVIVALGPDGGDVVAGSGDAGRVVDAPLVVELVVPVGSSTAVDLGIGPLGGPGSPELLVHAWWVTRVPGP